jgi:hypothetical protein
VDNIPYGLLTGFTVNILRLLPSFFDQRIRMPSEQIVALLISANPFKQKRPLHQHLAFGYGLSSSLMIPVVKHPASPRKGIVSISMNLSLLFHNHIICQ